jgi:hypothetical protein
MPPAKRQGVPRKDHSYEQQRMRSEAKAPSIRGWHMFTVCCTWIGRLLHLGGMHLCPKLAWHLHVPLNEKQVLGHGASSGDLREPSEDPHEILFPLWVWGQRWMVPFLTAFIDICLFTALFFNKHPMSWPTSSKVEILLCCCKPHLANGRYCSLDQTSCWLWKLDRGNEVTVGIQIESFSWGFF